MAKPTKAQISKLDRMIFQIEALEMALSGDPALRNGRVVDQLGQAKRHLIDALKEAERQ
jgi:hypothetical protein